MPAAASSASPSATSTATGGRTSWRPIAPPARLPYSWPIPSAASGAWAATFTLGAGLAAVVVADFDGNGRADIALVFSSGTTIVLGGDGRGSFTARSTTGARPDHERRRRRRLRPRRAAGPRGGAPRGQRRERAPEHHRPGRRGIVRRHTADPVPTQPGRLRSPSPSSSPTWPAPSSTSLGSTDSSMPWWWTRTRSTWASPRGWGSFRRSPPEASPWRRRSPTSTATGGPTCCWLRPRAD